MSKIVGSYCITVNTTAQQADVSKFNTFTERIAAGQTDMVMQDLVFYRVAVIILLQNTNSIKCLQQVRIHMESLFLILCFT